ncbi:MAG: methyltransferase type 11 [Sulfobacillus benefaciens]|uniref:Methyltransferase type 11 n=1 Tax=Sulfobacillus benefaciens TaxID=453960 RepID=A0A2T2XEL3_9FIRM|nr:MAG: methyltransferase type 11 [Sulfobacillus benefaciens]
MPMQSSDSLITSYFGRYHAAYRTSERHAHGSDLAHLIDSLHLQPNSLVLDAACGTGHTTLALASRGHRVVGMDMTPEMVHEAQDLAQSRGLSASWIIGNVDQLPWDPQTFDAVTCRRAAHHFQNLQSFLREAHRVLKPGGVLGISDMTAPTSAIDWLNQLETLRDPSHQAARSANQWCTLLGESGYDVEYLQVSVEPMTPTEWLAPVSTDSLEGNQALTFMNDHAPASILSSDQFLKYRLIITAVKS